MHPATEQVLRYFSYSHLPANLQEISRPFSELAHKIASQSSESPETTVALRKLLEAKDAAVRAALPPETTEQRLSRMQKAAESGFHGDRPTVGGKDVGEV